MQNIVKMAVVMVGLIGVTNPALPHSEMNKTVPENGSLLTEVPSTIGMSFGEKIRLTKILLQIQNQNPIDLDLQSYKGFEYNFSFPNPSKENGAYTINWRGLGIDGHVMKGEFSFNVE